MSRPTRALCLVLLALALTTTAARAVRLAGGDALSAHGERLWFRWAYRHPGVAAQLARARPLLAEGETLYLQVAANPDQVRWLRVMARYHLPEQELGGILEPGAAPPAPGTVVPVDLGVRAGGSRPPGGGAGGPPGIGEAGAGWPREAAAVLLGAAIAVGIGLAALRPGSLRDALAAAPLAGAAGLALLTAALYPPWRLGVPAGPASVLGVAAALGGGLAWLARRTGRGDAMEISAGGDGAEDRLPLPRPDTRGPATVTSAEAGDGAEGRPRLPHRDSPGPVTDTAPAAGPEAAPGARSWVVRPAAAAVWLPAAAALAAFIWKLTRVPLWSWDHYAIWGLKARRLFPGGALDVGWLVPGEHARPDYPLGLPLAWRALALGAEPGPAAFETAHALMAIALVVLVAQAARRLAGGGLGGGRLAGGAAAALAAASPLLWDTESLGLADLPLALFAVAAVAAVAPRLAAPAAAGTLRGGGARGAAVDPATAGSGAAARSATADGRAAGARGGCAGPPLWIAGACLGFLPWLKSEGSPLALLLLATLAVSLSAAAAEAIGAPGARATATARGSVRRLRRRRALLALAAPAVVLGAAGLAATPALGAREVGFFRGDWAGRGLARLGDAPRLLEALAADLLEAGWLGIWPLWAVSAVALAVLLVRRRAGRSGGAAAAAGLALSAAVALQLGLYAATYLVSYLPPDQHAKTSFFRVAAALAPLALLAAACALGGAGGTGRLTRATTAAAAPLPDAGGRG